MTGTRLIESVLALESAVVRDLGANEPFALTRTDVAFVILDGAVDLFFLNSEKRRFPLLRREKGTLFLGLGSQVLAVGTSDCRIAEVKLTEFLGSDGAILAVEEWVQVLGAALPQQRASSPVHQGTDLDAPLPDGAILIGTTEFCWGKLESADYYLFEDESLVAPQGNWLALFSRLWGSCSQETSLSRASSQELLEAGRLPGALSDFRKLALTCVEGNFLRDESAESAGLHRFVEEGRALMGSALDEIVAVMPDGRKVAHSFGRGSALLEACKLVANAQGMRIKKPALVGGHDHLSQIAQASRFRTRDVILEGRWWLEDSGPILAFLEEDGTPVALIPRRWRGFDMYIPSRGEQTRVDEVAAALLEVDAVVFYNPLPSKAVGKMAIAKFALGLAVPELVTILTMGVLAGILALASPMALEILVNKIIPSGERGELLTLSAGLLIAALAAGAYQLVRAFAVLRLEGKVDGMLQAAVIDRILRLPTDFFRRYQTGDLVNRALGINTMRQVLSGVVVSSVLGVVFSSFSLCLLIYYDWRLSILACILVILYAFLTLIVGLVELRFERPLLDLNGRLNSLTYQLISGIAKLNVAGAQSRAFLQWTVPFAKSRKLSLIKGELAVFSSVLRQVYHSFSLVLIFGFIAYKKYAGVNTGDFMGFMAAYGQFLGSVLSVSGTVGSILKVGPTYQRLEPILQAELEVQEELPEPGPLTGRVELCKVGFRYPGSQRHVLEDLSLKAEPGEFIAIVGPSGSGKSTLLRLLLGFDTPESGTVLFDGKELNKMNIVSVRRQLGVVLQDGSLMPGDVFSNIVGSSLLTLDDAWEATRVAGIEAEVKALPMGMHTVIGEGASSFSGGQVQRLMIARAVVSRPKVLLLDEATSALDGQTQKDVSDRLAGLMTTRIVIAHRLSTIRRADRIYVLGNKRIVQQGSYDELIDVPGPFQDLARRQLA